ncbi:MAG: 3-deoxy-D-manno-octulosonic acid transferase [Acetobacteraceae bacterium]|nr:3-deoxy-D-manno-octulosonic acid transferase [Acetobacteraceae bacterium]
MSLAGTVWHWGATAAAPLLPLHLRRRAAKGKEIPERLAERRGEGAARPPGRLLWLHAASVGETLSILPVLEALAERAPDLALLLTTGTVTSAGLLGRRLSPALAQRVIHRFVPLDVPGWVARFLDDWRPDAAAFVESELWPNLVAAAQGRGIPLALVNARLSERSARRWRWLPGLAREIAGGFDLVLAQSEADAARLRGIGAAGALCLGNLKDAAPPLPADPVALRELRQAVGERPVFLAASTHPGEEVIAIAAHAALAARHPGLLTILAPRHPERGPAVAAEAAGHAVARRGAGELPGPDTAIYVADTLGELGLFYRLAQVCLVGGSLVPHGGQNPLEPARLGCPILLGPNTWNFAESVARLLANGGARRVEGPDPPAALAAAVGDVLSDPGRGRAMAGAAAATVAPAAGLPGQVADALLRLLPGAGPGQRHAFTAPAERQDPA